MTHLLLIVLFTVCSAGAAISDLAARAGQSATYLIEPSKAAEFSVKLKAGDFLSLEVKPDECAVQAEAFDPTGSRFATYPADSGTFRIEIGADKPGVYRFKLTAPGEEESSEAAVQVMHVLSQEQRVNAAPEQAVASPLLDGLRAKLKSARNKVQRSAALAAFWQVVGAHSTPLIEDQKNENKNMAVTFLWRAVAPTKNVVVTLPPWNRSDWSDFQMAHLEGTDVWFKTLSLPRDARLPYRIAPNVSFSRGELSNAVLRSAERADPLNPHSRFSDPQETDPRVSAQMKYSVLEMPKAPEQAWIAKRAKVAEGKVETRELHSDLFKNDRTISVYLPVGYAAGAGPYDVLIILDRKEYLSFVPTPQILDNLIGAGAIHPLIAVLVDFVSETRVEELSCNRQFADFLSNELIPLVRNYYPITKDPARTIIAGSGWGGLAAACAGLHHPEVFGNVLSQSGEFGWSHLGRRNDAQPSELLEPDELPRKFARSRMMPLRFYLDAGTDEGIGPGDRYLASLHLRDVLIARGYEVHWQQFSGANDYLNWRGTLADGLLALVGVRH